MVPRYAIIAMVHTETGGEVAEEKKVEEPESKEPSEEDLTSQRAEEAFEVHITSSTLLCCII
jgi:hypothetical protein